ncbi:MAG: hypothetical protein HQK56_09580 [Deltaproteobacteria bacterium]|nr:hypothetical protein [Deltaproteobacteria bacterium]
MAAQDILRPVMMVLFRGGMLALLLVAGYMCQDNRQRATSNRQRNVIDLRVRTNELIFFKIDLVTLTPTKFVYVKFVFEPTEETGSIIHQLGIFFDTVRANGVPGGQAHLVPAEVSDPGFCYMVENIVPFERVVGKSESFEYIFPY